MNWAQGLGFYLWNMQKKMNEYTLMNSHNVTLFDLVNVKELTVFFFFLYRAFKT